jgi:DNA-binding transcriptional MerR regulator
MENESFIPLRELEFDLLANFGINARTFQFYKSEGLIPKPKRIGKNTGYNKEYLYKVLIAVKKLQDNFHLSINELKPIIKYSISERLLDRLHKDLKQLENDFPIIWPESINDGEGWGTVYINRKIRRLYLLTWQLCYGKKYAPPYTIEAIEALVKHETVTESGFKYRIETELAVLDASEISYEGLVKEVKKMEKLPRRGNWR